jgi:hypothetical protein
MRPRRETDHSPPSIAEFKNEWSCQSTPSTRIQAAHKAKSVCKDTSNTVASPNVLLKVQQCAFRHFIKLVREHPVCENQAIPLIFRNRASYI